MVSEYSKDGMSRLEDRIVNNQNIAQRMRVLGLNQYRIMSRGEEQNHEENSDSILSKLFEAIIGAVSVDSGYDPDTVSGVVLRLLGEDDRNTLLTRYEDN